MLKTIKTSVPTFLLPISYLYFKLSTRKLWIDKKIINVIKYKLFV